MLFTRKLFRNEAGHDALEVTRRDGDVRVVDEQEVVAGVQDELNQSTDLAVGSQPLRTFDELDGERGKLGLQLLDGCGGRVGEGGDAEEKLVVASVGLAAVAAEGFDHAGVEALEGLEDGDAGGEGG